jgi:4a-hydroxytetrahydrobiopterin dehydratase
MDLKQKHCIPCEEGGEPLGDEQEDQMKTKIGDEWLLLRSDMHLLRRQWVFEDFMKAVAFVNRVAVLAEEEGHHPDIRIVYNKVQLDLYTHAVGGLSENDFILASKINDII